MQLSEKIPLVTVHTRNGKLGLRLHCQTRHEDEFLLVSQTEEKHKPSSLTCLFLHFRESYNESWLPSNMHYTLSKRRRNSWKWNPINIYNLQRQNSKHYTIIQIKLLVSFLLLFQQRGYLGNCAWHILKTCLGTRCRVKSKNQEVIVVDRVSSTHPIFFLMPLPF